MTCESLIIQYRRRCLHLREHLENENGRHEQLLRPVPTVATHPALSVFFAPVSITVHFLVRLVTF